jgi:hypothetical protein
LQAAHHAGERGREDDFAVEPPAAGAERAPGPLVQGRHLSDGLQRGERHGGERPDDRDEHDRALRDPEPDHRQRHPGDEGRDLQRDHQRADRPPRELVEGQPQPKGDTEHHRHHEGERQADKRLDRRFGDRAVADTGHERVPDDQGGGDRRAVGGAGRDRPQGDRP